MSPSEDAVPAAPGVLDGVSVLEVTSELPGAQCGALLALLGAEVIKVESAARPDRARLAGPFPAGAVDREHSGLHRYLHARKRSVALDVATPSGRSLLDRLAATADVLLDDGALGRPPDVAATYAELRAAHERLIVVAFSPYGLDGPKADWVSTELTALAASGWLKGDGDRPQEEPLMPGSSAPALGVGTLGAIGVLLALAARRRSGAGQLVEVPEQAALLSLLPFPTAMFAYVGHDHGRLGDRHPYGIYPCVDGHLGVSILTQGHWTALCRLMDRPDLAGDPALADGELRARPDAVARIDAAITAWAADKAAVPTFEAGQALGVPVTIIPSPRQVLGSAQYAARGFWFDHPDGVLGPLRLPGPPYPAGAGTFAPFRDAPHWGEDTAAVLDRLGVDADERSALAALGVL